MSIQSEITRITGLRDRLVARLKALRVPAQDYINLSTLSDCADAVESMGVVYISSGTVSFSTAKIASLPLQHAGSLASVLILRLNPNLPNDYTVHAISINGTSATDYKCVVAKNGVEIPSSEYTWSLGNNFVFTFQTGSYVFDGDYSYIIATV